MKNVAKPLDNLSAQSMKAVKNPVTTEKSLSPYLKAILAGKANTEIAATRSQDANTSLAAALRYIANSK